MGKHGNLEWLPGKALALSEDCFPEAALGPLPVIYPFIVNDPGEGAQAKRRTAAVVVDHLMPPMARAESYGPAAEIEALIDEYAAAEAGDPRRAKRGRRARSSILPQRARLRPRPRPRPERRSQTARSQKLDAHICDLKELQIRDGLHVLGEGPDGTAARGDAGRAGARAARRAARRAMHRCSARSPTISGSASIRSIAISRSRGTGRGRRRWRIPSPLAGEGQGGGKAAATSRRWRTYGDTVERLEALALELVSSYQRRANGRLGSTIRPPSLTLPRKGGGKVPGARSRRPCHRSPTTSPRPSTPPARARSPPSSPRSTENSSPPGPSGAPTRGRADCLPTGRNFYSVDVRAVPTPAAWELGRRSADLLAERYFQDEGEWPQAIALTVWGTSNMRTGGDDIAQALALIGARPVWEGASGRVTGVEVMPLSELKRPRIDVTLRISGFFRDAFPTPDRALPRGGAGGRRARRAGRRQPDRRAHPRRCRAACRGRA